MSIINARYKIVTPMFMAGADQKDLAELRPPSFRVCFAFGLGPLPCRILIINWKK